MTSTQPNGICSKYASNTHCHRLIAELVRVDQTPEIRLSDEITVDDKDGPIRFFRKHGEWPPGAERFGFTQVVDLAAEPAAVAEMSLDQLAEVAH